MAPAADPAVEQEDLQSDVQQHTDVPEQPADQQHTDPPDESSTNTTTETSISPARLYDRVYCGAAVPTEYVDAIKRLVRVGGRAIMPVNDQVHGTLYCIARKWL